MIFTHQPTPEAAAVCRSWVRQEGKCQVAYSRETTIRVKVMGRDLKIPQYAKELLHGELIHYSDMANLQMPRRSTILDEGMEQDRFIPRD